MSVIFILDDDENILSAFNLFLPEKGYEVSTFTHTQDLLDALCHTIPDLILLDVRISEPEDGKSVCTTLKHHYHYPNKIYLFSATPVSERDMQKCEADGFIEKPFDMYDFLNTLEKAIGKAGNE